MKRIIAVGVLVIGLAASALALYKTGWGTETTSTTTVEQLSGFTANTVSLINNGSNTVYALSNTSTNEFATRLAAETCIPIPAGATWTWNYETQGSINNIFHITTNGTSPIVVGAF